MPTVSFIVATTAVIRVELCLIPKPSRIDSHLILDSYSVTHSEFMQITGASWDIPASSSLYQSAFFTYQGYLGEGGLAGSTGGW
jgi:hypothetical protein